MADAAARRTLLTEKRQQLEKLRKQRLQATAAASERYDSPLVGTLLCVNSCSDACRTEPPDAPGVPAEEEPGKQSAGDQQAPRQRSDSIEDYVENLLQSSMPGPTGTGGTGSAGAGRIETVATRMGRLSNVRIELYDSVNPLYHR